jgi:hypothetical protein
MIEVNGDWIGYYTFDKGYSEWLKTQAVPFRITIQLGIHEFVGRVFEEPAYGGIDDEIVIRGRQHGNEIEFTKQYSLEHYLDRNDQLVSVKSNNPTIVYYKGYYNEASDTIKGQWEIPRLEEDDEGIFHARNATGHWEIWREL